MKTTRLVLAVMTLFAADTNGGTQEQLAAYRQQIDSIDQRNGASRESQGRKSGIQSPQHPSLIRPKQTKPVRPD